ncbi:hypothetical protein TWF694_005472 [Orbilia ellipsospora]|uniref:Uncharacterized protein n=1 Tax=Orbilia ellipsospora TaxID=2528407 RepID=A0AAV9WT69_9PEZI
MSNVTSHPESAYPSAPSPPQQDGRVVGYMQPAHLPPSPQTLQVAQVESSAGFHHSLYQTKKTLNPLGVHALDVPYSPGDDPETQRIRPHHQYSNGQYHQPPLSGTTYESNVPPSYVSGPSSKPAAYVYTQAQPQQEENPTLFDFFVRVSKGRAGAVWYCISSFCM